MKSHIQEIETGTNWHEAGRQGFPRLTLAALPYSIISAETGYLSPNCSVCPFYTRLGWAQLVSTYIKG